MQINNTISADTVGQYVRRKLAGLVGGPELDEIVEDLKGLVRDRVEFGPGRAIVKEGDRCNFLYLISSGWVLRSRSMSSGRRQIVGYGLDGDLLCLDSALFGSSSFDVMARTPVSLLRIETPALLQLFQRRRGLAMAMALAAGRDESILAERVVSMGRRDSLEKLAHALCELAARVEASGRMHGDTLEAPFNQEDFADLLGISVIHVNRTFRKLSEERIAEYGKGRIQLLDRRRLAQIAGFHSAYLRLEGAQT